MKKFSIFIASIFIAMMAVGVTYGFGVDSGGFGVTTVNIGSDPTPSLAGDLDANEYDIDDVGDIIHDDSTASDWFLKNEDQDKDIIFSLNDGGVQTVLMTIDGSAGVLSGVLKATGSGVLQSAVADSDYLANIVADTTPQLGASLDAQEYDLDNVGSVIHDDATPSDFTLQNIDQDQDITFSGNDGGAQTDIMKLDVSEGQLSGVMKATAGVLGAASEGTDYYAPSGTDVAVADGGTGLSTVAAGSVMAANALDTVSAVTYTGSGGYLYNAAGTVQWKDSVVPYKAVADPCGTYEEGTMFYNDTSNYMCYCNGSNDVKMSDDTTACF